MSPLLFKPPDRGIKIAA